jgi:hypothetical protein
MTMGQLTGNIAVLVMACERSGVLDRGNQIGCPGRNAVHSNRNPEPQFSPQ